MTSGEMSYNEPCSTPYFRRPHPTHALRLPSSAIRIQVSALYESSARLNLKNDRTPLRKLTAFDTPGTRPRKTSRLQDTPVNEGCRSNETQRRSPPLPVTLIRTQAQANVDHSEAAPAQAELKNNAMCAFIADKLGTCFDEGTRSGIQSNDHHNVDMWFSRSPEHSHRVTRIYDSYRRLEREWGESWTCLSVLTTRTVTNRNVFAAGGVAPASLVPVEKTRGSRYPFATDAKGTGLGLNNTCG
ncbi:hypothetical protein C8F01DRAFT_1077761 [Mycena amicta]|nr:hypothetical protein C8F01DRAFT_1077761 [Mycena amicta]